jgi:hypothetical protein
MVITPAVANEDQLRVAHDALRAAEARFGPMAYARVDLVQLDATPVVLELELLDPVLFFAAGDPEGAGRLAGVLAALLTDF